MQESVEMQEVSASQAFTDEQPSMEVSLQEFDELVEKYKAYKRLVANEDFKRIIVEEYLTEDFNRLSGLLKVVNNKNVVAARDKIVEKIVAKGHLENYLNEIEQGLHGIDNPEQRVALVKELEAMANANPEE